MQESELQEALSGSGRRLPVDIDTLSMFASES